MTAGRPNTPIEKQLLTAKGDGITPGGRRVIPKGTVAVIPGRRNKDGGVDRRYLPKVPKDLKAPGRKMWFQIWDNGPWLHPEEDQWWVETAAKRQDMIEVFRAQVEVDGLMIKNYAGADTSNPLLKEITECERIIMKCLSTLGFSPSDRARLGLAELKRQSGLADLQSRQHNRTQDAA